MRENPFMSTTFTSTWLNHFNGGKDGRTEPSIETLTFVRHRRFPYFVNTGSRFTKGITYHLNEDPTRIGRGVLLIHDVLTYEQPDEQALPNNTGLYVSRQYPGYLIDLKGYTSLQDFLKKKFSKSSRYKLTKYKKRLETAFGIRYEMYCGEMDKGTYTKLFSDFRELLEKRFDEKQEYNNNLEAEEWAFFYDVAYPMLLEKQAGLFVVYEGSTPIAVTLNFMSDTTVFDAITVFDIDYAKFHLGSVSVMGLIEWCISNGKEILDFSKGEYEYKKRWCTREYFFEYHVLYNKRSPFYSLLAWLLISFFRLKQKLREWKVNDWLHRYTYRLRNKENSEAAPKINFTIKECEGEIPVSALEVEPGDPDFNLIRPALFEFLYLFSENLKDTSVFRLQDQSQEYMVRGLNNQATVRFLLD